MLPAGFGVLNILIVEDLPQTRRLLRTVLRHLGLERVSEAGNITEAFALIKTSPPDLVFTDWDMPGGSGLDLVQMIRNHPDSPDPSLAVIMLTAHGGPTNVTQGREAGATDFLVKPFSPARLEERILDVVSNPRGFVVTPNYRGTDRRRVTRPVARDRRAQSAALPKNVQIFQPDGVLSAKVFGDAEALEQALRKREQMLRSIQQTPSATLSDTESIGLHLDGLAKEALQAVDSALELLHRMGQPLQHLRKTGLETLPASADRVMLSLQTLIGLIEQRDSPIAAVRLHLLVIRAMMRAGQDASSLRLAEELAAQLERVAAEEAAATASLSSKTRS